MGQKVKFIYKLFACRVGTFAKGGVGFVRNGFKKKSCGASPLNGETNFKFVTMEGFNFDAIEKSVLQGSIGFGTPDSKLTQHEQYLEWKRMILSGEFVDRDDFCNKMLVY